MTSGISGDPTTMNQSVPSSSPAAASRGFVVLVVTAAALVVIAALVGFTEWKDKQPNADGLANKVIDSMNTSLSNDEQFHQVGLHIASLTVMHTAGNMFEGQATAATDTGSDHQVTVHIAYDGDTLLWRTDPGSFMFAAQEELQGTS